MATKKDIEMRSIETPLLVIVGETASGKSRLAVDLAKKFNGEIIAADSRTVYKGLDIGTAKPSPSEQKSIHHHLINIVEVSQLFTVADFKRLANEAITDIGARGKLPIMVGGSGLYINSIIFNYQFSEPGQERDLQNPRHLKKSGKETSHNLRPNTLVIGLTRSKNELKERISMRVDAMFAAGLLQEAKQFSKKYGWDARALQAPAYKSIKSYVKGDVSLEEAKALFIKYDLDLAKRQRSWFKRNKNIHWVDDPSKTLPVVEDFLNKQ